MIQPQIQRLAKKRGIKDAIALRDALSAQTGQDVQRAVAHRLWKGEMRMLAFETIDQLCDVLNCTPNELLGYKKNNRS
jgi:DNA-binding Xre family transcriptional regulator